MFKTLKSWLIEWDRRLMGKPSKFVVGESVQLIDGSDELMIVTNIVRSRELNEPLITCKWTDPERKEVRTRLFPESKLKRFDWQRALRVSHARSLS